MAQKPHQPTELSRKLVAALSGYGLRQEDIAKHPDVAVSENTLRKHYAEELERGNSKALGLIGEGLFQKAIKGDTTALIFLAKTRLGFREVTRVENTGADGGPIEVTDRADEFTRRIAGLAAREDS